MIMFPGFGRTAALSMQALLVQPGLVAGRYAIFIHLLVAQASTEPACPSQLQQSGSDAGRHLFDSSIGLTLCPEHLRSGRVDPLRV